ncbi:MAG TPA: hypothetical protein VFZ97_03080 [Acidimicrobiales bacterium]
MTPPLLVMVTFTIGIGQYGGGVEGNIALEGVIRTLAAVTTVGFVFTLTMVVEERVVLGGEVTGGWVVTTATVVVVTGLTVVVDWGAVVVVAEPSVVRSAGCRPAAVETTAECSPWPTRTVAVKATTPPTANPSKTDRRGRRPRFTRSGSVVGRSTVGRSARPRGYLKRCTAV